LILRSDLYYIMYLTFLNEILNFVAEFIRKKIPFNVFKRIEHDNFNDFLGGWSDNRARALIFEPRSLTRLRYLLTAFEFYDRVAFG